MYLKYILEVRQTQHKGDPPKGGRGYRDSGVQLQQQLIATAQDIVLLHLLRIVSCFTCTSTALPTGKQVRQGIRTNSSSTVWTVILTNRITVAQTGHSPILPPTRIRPNCICATATVSCSCQMLSPPSRYVNVIRVTILRILFIFKGVSKYRYFFRSCFTMYVQ